MKTCSPQELSCILRQQFYWGIFSFGLRDVVNLSTTFFIQRFFTFFIFLHKNAFFNVFYSWGQHFFTSMLSTSSPYKKVTRLGKKNKDENEKSMASCSL